MILRETWLYVDHRPNGVASTVAQRYFDQNGGPLHHPIHHNSRVLRATETRYGNVEGELLAVLSGIKSNKMYLYGSPFTVVVDHRPLEPLYNDPSRPSPARDDRHHSKLLGFDFNVVYKLVSSSLTKYL